MKASTPTRRFCRPPPWPTLGSHGPATWAAPFTRHPRSPTVSSTSTPSWEGCPRSRSAAPAEAGPAHHSGRPISASTRTRHPRSPTVSWLSVRPRRSMPSQSGATQVAEPARLSGKRPAGWSIRHRRSWMASYTSGPATACMRMPSGAPAAAPSARPCGERPAAMIRPRSRTAWSTPEPATACMPTRWVARRAAHRAPHFGRQLTRPG